MQNQAIQRAEQTFIRFPRAPEHSLESRFEIDWDLGALPQDKFSQPLDTAPSLYRMNFVIIKGNIRQNSSKLREDKSWNVPRS